MIKFQYFYWFRYSKHVLRKSEDHLSTWKMWKNTIIGWRSSEFTRHSTNLWNQWLLVSVVREKNSSFMGHCSKRKIGRPGFMAHNKRQLNFILYLIIIPILIIPIIKMWQLDLNQWSSTCLRIPILAIPLWVLRSCYNRREVFWKCDPKDRISLIYPISNHIQEQLWCLARFHFIYLDRNRFFILNT